MGGGRSSPPGTYRRARRVGEVVLDVDHDERGPRVEIWVMHAILGSPWRRVSSGPRHAFRYGPCPPSGDRKTPLVWGTFLSLAIIWGSSFLFIKIGLDAGMTPLTLVTWRLGIAAALLLVLLRLSGGRFPVGRAPSRRFVTLA